MIGTNDAAAKADSPLQLDVTETLRAWLNGEANLGWALLPLDGGSNGVDFRSSEYASLNDRPMLVVDYLVPEPATILLLAIPCLFWRRLLGNR